VYVPFSAFRANCERTTNPMTGRRHILQGLILQLFYNDVAPAPGHDA
jgi:hypothetical protein